MLDNKSSEFENPRNLSHLAGLSADNRWQRDSNCDFGLYAEVPHRNLIPVAGKLPATVDHCARCQLGVGVRACLLIMLLRCVTGCDVSRTTSSIGNTELSGAPLDVDSVADQTVADQQPLADLCFDFGIVRPNERLSHSFRIRNPTADFWTVADVLSSCSCTVVGEVKRVIEPRGELNVPVGIKFGSESGDVEQFVRLKFARPENRVIQLRAIAKIRDELTFSKTPALVEFTENTKFVATRIDVWNYSKSDWRDISISHRLDDTRATCRLSCTAALKNDGLSPADGARQVWELGIAANLHGSESGVVYLHVAAVGEHGDVVLTRELPVHYRCPPMVVSYPSKLLFSKQDFESAPRKALLVFNPKTDVPDGLRINVQCEPDAKIRVRWYRKSDRCIQLEFDLSESAREALSFTGSVNVEVGGSIIHRIPLRMVYLPD
jgi:hypothetical protein